MEGKRLARQSLKMSLNMKKQRMEKVIWKMILRFKKRSLKYRMIRKMKFMKRSCKILKKKIKISKSKLSKVSKRTLKEHQL